MIWCSNAQVRTWLPKLQCHRGYWVEGLPQNTIESIKQAHLKKYKMVEFDVRLTRDQVVVLFHDETIKNKRIDEINFNEMQKLVKTDTLEELFKWFVTTGDDFKLNIEIKSQYISNYTLEKKVCELIKKYQINHRVLISSFNPISLAKVRFFNSNIYRALLLSFAKEEANSILVKSGLLNYVCYPHILNLRSVDYSRHFKNLAKKIPIVLWTVNEFEIYDKNRDEIHGIISDKITPEEF